MNLKEIHGHLKAKFNDAIGEWVEPEAGDGWIEVAAGAFHQVCEYLKSDPQTKFDYLRSISGVDYPPDQIQSVYHLFSYDLEHDAILKVKLDRNNPAMPSVMDIWPAADWHERETYDLLGIVYQGHPNLRRILLPDDWTGFPLRKDYKQPDEYHGVSNW
ncbi:NADH-quinone oxidoreductase subunit C [Candidatus Sumerlaeota bacterium]|nr:NADH-quinone oxidoreductase subunit C [Candidatus Sumerlaeota bacterium]